MIIKLLYEVFWWVLVFDFGGCFKTYVKSCRDDEYSRERIDCNELYEWLFECLIEWFVEELFNMIEFFWFDDFIFVDFFVCW